MSKRNFGSIKSILHFDFPYFNEPNDGLGDEASSETWTKVGSTRLAGTQIPYAKNAAPKFGYRCAYFPNNSSYIKGTNESKTFDIVPSKNYEIEAFLKFSGAGNIFNFDNALKQVAFANFNGHTFASFIDYAVSLDSWSKTKSFCEQLGGHLVTITSAEKQAFIQNFISEAGEWFLLGATYDEQENTWKWVTGEELNYNNWNAEELREYVNNPGEFICASINSESGEWYTIPKNDGYYPFICEWDNEIESLNFPSLLLSVKEDGTLALSGICDEVTSSIAMTLNTWQHVLLRISEGYCTLYLDGVQVLGAETPENSIILPSEIQLGGFIGYMDEFVFRASASSGTPKIPAAPYNATVDVGLVGGFGNGSDGDVTISANTQINSYGLINSITDAKTFTVNSWSNGYSYFNGHTFQYFSTTKTWQDAKSYCENLGGHLATSTSEEKNDFLTSIANNNTVWLGGTDEEQEGTWKWITGEEWNYTNWKSNEPDNANDNQHYAGLLNNKTWRDYANTSKYRFICEWDYNIENISEQELMIHITAPISTTSADYPSVGLYAFSKIANHNGANITLEDDITIENGFDFTLNNELLNTYFIQVIRVPHFNTLTINSGKSITPPTWNTFTGGGIVAFRCKRDCTINGSIITHGLGAVRYDWCQMENSKLIDRFLCAQGGGIFITCGGTFTTSESARLGASWSGEGDDSNGAAGYGGNGGSSSMGSSGSECYILPSSGGVGGGGGGGVMNVNNYITSGGVKFGISGGDVGSDGASGQQTGFSSGGGGGGCGGRGGIAYAKEVNSTNCRYTVSGSGGGGQGNSGGKSGVAIGYTTSNGTKYAGTTGEKANGVNGGNSIQNTESSSANANSWPCGGAGGGGPGGNGGDGKNGSKGIAGACIILLCNTLSAHIKSISTGGSCGAQRGSFANTFTTESAAGGGGTGFCYISAEELK